MRGKGIVRVALTLGLIVANLIAWSAKSAFARGEESNWGQCAYYGGNPPVCHCEDPITTQNCSFDSDCNFGICGAS